VRGWPSVLVLAVFSCFAIACGIFVLVAQTQQAQAVVAAIFLLAIGQLFAIGLGWARGLTLQDAIRSLARERRAADEKYSKSFVTAKLFENEIAELKRRMGLSEKEIQDEMAAMRIQFQELAKTFNEHLWPPIPQDTRVRETAAYGKTLWDYSPDSAAMEGYLEGRQKLGGYRQVLGRMLEVIND
jgi:F0F1-type ATP synthase membrane subunit c/vacuolar-type H+-ATPase subunit K